MNDIQFEILTKLLSSIGAVIALLLLMNFLALALLLLK
jgi:hypothetical protein